MLFALVSRLICLGEQANKFSAGKITTTKKLAKITMTLAK